ncbi:MAG: CHC2 zinc finger domain-containing protein, partial [Pseudomonadota bacterium]
MSYRDDPRRFQAKTIPMAEVVTKLGIARLQTHGNELIGPCPLCGGRDRFGINLRTTAFNCRQCDLRGGDQIALVMGVLNLDFQGALQVLCGEKPAELDQKEIERRRRISAEANRRQREAQERYRRRAVS